MSSYRIVAPLFNLSVEKTDRDVMKAEWLPLHREISPEPTDCPCGQHGIVELCWIRNIVNNRELYIGNCCINFIAPKGYCAKCRIYPVVSQAAHYCEFCGHNRKDAPSGVVQKGSPLYGKPIKGLSYSAARLANPEYAHYIRTTPKTWKYNDPHYLQYLQLTHERNSMRPKRTISSVATK
jgi:hypothetical protein